MGANNRLYYDFKSTVGTVVRSCQSGCTHVNQHAMMPLLLALLTFLLLAALAASTAPISVTASVRGKKYEVEAVTVEEFTEKVENIAGLEAGQNSVLFRGKVLSPSDKLEEMGISAGDVLMVVKGKKQRQATQAGTMDDVPATPSSSVSSSSPGMGKGLPGFPGMPNMDNVSPEDMQNAMQQMDALLDSNFVDEYFGDDEKLEAARQQMVSNLDQYEQMMPGFREQAGHIISDPTQWREAMTKAKEQILKLKAQRDMTKGQAPKGTADSVDDFEDEDN